MSFLVLLPIAFAAGVITVFTPCILPVLPVVLAGGATAETRRKPYAIVAGIVTTFTLFTLAGAWIFRTLGLSLKWQLRVAVVMLLLLAATLLVPRIGEWLERPFFFLTRRRSGDLGGGFLLGASLGLVFAPCAGPVFTVVSVAEGTHRVSAEIVFIAVAYALGAALPMLLIAKGGRAMAHRFRARADLVRYSGAAVMVVLAVTIWQWPVWLTDLQTHVPGYAAAVQNAVEKNGVAKRQLAKLNTNTPKGSVAAAGSTTPTTTTPVDRSGLPDYGPAPEFAGIQQWLNTPGGRPLTLAGLRGRVVLLDFWTYSCINCLRTLPHLEAWDRAYRKDGLTIIGVHTPEFPFEHVVSNVRTAAKDLGVKYPIAIDNAYGTWNAWGNNSWPAEYLIDRNGHVRSYEPGEGNYDESEVKIRNLLAAAGHTPTNQFASMPDKTPTDEATPESYLGFQRLERYAGPVAIKQNVATTYQLPLQLPQNELAYGGTWKIGPQQVVAGRNARLDLHFHAKDVYLVLGGKGTVMVLVNGKTVKRVPISGISRLYTLLSYPQTTDARLELCFAPGISGYAFTFG